MIFLALIDVNSSSNIRVQYSLFCLCFYYPPPTSFSCFILFLINKRPIRSLLTYHDSACAFHFFFHYTSFPSLSISFAKKQTKKNKLKWCIINKQNTTSTEQIEGFVKWDNELLSTDYIYGFLEKKTFTDCQDMKEYFFHFFLLTQNTTHTHTRPIYAACLHLHKHKYITVVLWVLNDLHSKQCLLNKASWHRTHQHQTPSAGSITIWKSEEWRKGFRAMRESGEKECVMVTQCLAFWSSYILAHTFYIPWTVSVVCVSGCTNLNL